MFRYHMFYVWKFEHRTSKNHEIFNLAFFEIIVNKLSFDFKIYCT